MRNLTFLNFFSFHETPTWQLQEKVKLQPLESEMWPERRTPTTIATTVMMDGWSDDARVPAVIPSFVGVTYVIILLWAVI